MLKLGSRAVAPSVRNEIKEYVIGGEIVLTSRASSRSKSTALEEDIILAFKLLIIH
jgi:hypothetical protein